MTTRRSIIAATAATAFAPRVFAQGAYWPTAAAWEKSDPKTAGFDAAKLAAVVATAMADASGSLMVLKNGKIVTEVYGTGWDAAHTRPVESVGKSFNSVLVGMAIDDGKIKGVEQSASDFVPEWRETPKAAITIRHLLTMTSGVAIRDLAVRNITGDQAAINAAAPLARPPGSAWTYSTPMYHLLFHIIARATGEKFETYAQRKLLDPLGMKSTWQTQKGKNASGGEVTNYYTAICTARDLARFGLFALAGGAWNGKQLVNAAYFKASTSPSQDLNPSYGYLWWENAKAGTAAGGGNPGFQFGAAPRDTFAALGAGGQVVIVVPSQKLVVIRQGEAPQGPAQHATLINAVIGAV